MEIKPITITTHAIDTLLSEFEYLKASVSVEYAQNFRNEFIRKTDGINPNYFSYPECRFLPTKNKIYRNIIWGDYLIVFKVLAKEILVLGIFHTKQNPGKLKSYRRIKE